ncbi:hypothetical protein BH09SUM1_BH09SUM1_18440 [soil metagenome]
MPHLPRFQKLPSVFAHQSFLQSFVFSAGAVGQLLLIICVGFLFVKRGWLNDQALKGLTRLLIDVVAPCSLGLSLAKGFNMGVLDECAPLLVLPALWIIVTVVACKIYFRFWKRGADAITDNAATAMAAMQNSYYIPLSVVTAIIPAAQRDLAVVFVGICVLSVNPLQWTLGTWLLVPRDEETRRDWRHSLAHVVNAPIIGIVAGALFSFIPAVASAAQNTPESNYALRMIFQSVGAVGACMNGLAMVILGGLIASCPLTSALRFRLLLPVFLSRFLIVPGVIFLMLRSGSLNVAPLAAFVLLLEAACPSAMNLALAARRFEGEWETISSLLVIVNCAAVLILPFWMAAGFTFFR